jgi:hypothetical protein
MLRRSVWEAVSLQAVIAMSGAASGTLGDLALAQKKRRTLARRSSK